jgi:hypothetical protein
MKLLHVAMLGSLLVGCEPADFQSESITEEEADLSASSGGFSLALSITAPQGGLAHVHGRANQDLQSALAFIPDDEVGSTQVAGRAFTSSFGASDLPMFLTGKPVFFGLSTATQSDLTGRGDLTVKMHLSSPVGIRVSANAASVLVGGVAFVRVQGTFTEPLVAAKTQVGGQDLAGTVQGKKWTIDFPLSFMGDAIANQKPIWILLTTARDEFSANLDAALHVSKVSLTTSDPYAVWAAPACTPSVLACVTAHGPDTAVCGNAFTVAPCWAQLHP